MPLSTEYCAVFTHARLQNLEKISKNQYLRSIGSWTQNYRSFRLTLRQGARSVLQRAQRRILTALSPAARAVGPLLTDQEDLTNADPQDLTNTLSEPKSFNSMSSMSRNPKRSFKKRAGALTHLQLAPLALQAYLPPAFAFPVPINPDLKRRLRLKPLPLLRLAAQIKPGSGTVQIQRGLKALLRRRSSNSVAPNAPYPPSRALADEASDEDRLALKSIVAIPNLSDPLSRINAERPPLNRAAHNGLTAPSWKSSTSSLSPPPLFLSPFPKNTSFHPNLQTSKPNSKNSKKPNSSILESYTIENRPVACEKNPHPHWLSHSPPTQAISALHVPITYWATRVVRYSQVATNDPLFGAF